MVCVVDGLRSNYTTDIVIPAGSDSGPSGGLRFPEEFSEIIAVLTGWQPAGFWYSEGDKSFHGNNFPSRSEKTSQTTCAAQEKENELPVYSRWCCATSGVC